MCYDVCDHVCEDVCYDWYWCIGCQRAHQLRDYVRVPAGNSEHLIQCPQKGCGFFLAGGSLSWDELREDYPSFPRVPRLGNRYVIGEQARAFYYQLCQEAVLLFCRESGRSPFGVAVPVPAGLRA